MEEARLKRGDTIDWLVTVTVAGAPLDLTGWTVEAEIRTTDASRAVAVTLVATLADQGVSPGQLVLSYGDTSAIAPGRYICDLRRTLSGASRASDTWAVIVEQEVTPR